jgi:fibronectin type 3 domain-containing protein
LGGKEGGGSYVWDTSEVGSGTYYVYGRIDDGRNLAVVSYSVGTVKVEDSTAPAAPSAPSVSLEDGVAELSWEANAEDDVIGYEVYYGPEPDTYSGSYNATNLTSFRLPQEPSPQTAYMAVSAYDSSGNSSPLSEEVRLWFVYLPVVLKNQH